MGDQPLLLRTDKIRGLLAYLTLSGQQAYRRETLATLFWPEYTDEMARGNLRTSLSRLRKAVRAIDADLDRRLITGRRGMLGFASNGDDELVLCDVVRFRRLLTDCANHAHEDQAQCDSCAERMSAAAQLFQGDLLAGFSLPDSPPFDDWLLLERESLHQQGVTLLLAQANRAYQQGESVTCEAYTRRILGLEPWHEECHRLLMSSLAAQNQWGAALKQYEQARQILQRELGVDVSQATTDLYCSLRERSLPASMPRTEPSAPLSLGSLSVAPGQPSPPAVDLADVPSIDNFVGRAAQLAWLAHWLGGERQGIVAILGIGGVGKTTLAAQTVRTQAAGFQRILWRTLVNAPPVADLLGEWIAALAHPHIPSLPSDLDGQIALLLDALRGRRVLLVLDNLESLLEGGARQGHFRNGYEAYAQLLQRLAAGEHRGYLLITSREQPRILARLARSYAHVTSLDLSGFSDSEAGQLLARWKLRGDRQQLRQIVERYSGNPLALGVVAETIDELFNGEIAAFLRLPSALFEDIEDALDQQFSRLSPLETDILGWLAIERVACRLDDLHSRLLSPAAQQETVAALRALLRRSLVAQQPGESQPRFYLQNVLTEYVTNRLVTGICREISDQTPVLLHSHGLLVAQAADNVIAAQRRMLLQPVAEELLARRGYHPLAEHLRTFLQKMADDPLLSQGYGPGNLLNLMLHIGLDVAGLDLSGVVLRQLALQNARLPSVNLSGATFVGCTFTDTVGGILSIALSPDERLLAAATDMGEIRLWQREGGQEIGRLRLAGSHAWAVAFSPDGRLLAGCAGRTIHLWRIDEEEGAYIFRSIQTLTAHAQTVRSLAFHPQGGQLASAGEDRKVLLWNICEEAGEVTGIEEAGQLAGHEDRVFRVVYNPEGSLLASAGAGTKIRVWDVAQQKIRWVLQGHRERIAGLAFSPDGRLLVSGGVDRELRVWQIESGQCSHTLRQHTDALLSVAFTPDGRTLASAGHGPDVRLWDTADWQPLRQWRIERPTPPNIWGLVFAGDNRELIVAGLHLPLQSWDTAKGHRIHARHSWNNSQNSADFHPFGRWVAVGGSDGVLSVLDIADPTVPRQIARRQLSPTGIRTVAYAPHGRWLVTGGQDGEVRLWRHTLTGDGVELQLLDEPTRVPGNIASLAVGPEGRFLLVGSQRGELFLWEIGEGGAALNRPARQINAHTQGLWGLAIHPSGTIAATGGDDWVVRLWDLTRGVCIQEIPGFQNRVGAVAYSRNGELLALGGFDGILAIWSEAEQRITHRFAAHRQSISAVRFADDNLLVVAATDGVISVWLLEKDGSATFRHHLIGHSAWVNQISVASDGRLLISASHDGSARLWDYQSGACLTEWQPPGPYAGTNIHGVRGVTPAQKNGLLALGAVDEPPSR